MKYKFIGINDKGRVIRAVIHEESHWRAINKLKMKGIRCVSCKAIEEKDENLLEKKISLKDLSLLCRTLKNNLKSGIPIIATLKLTEEHIKNRSLKKVLKSILSIIEGGNTLTEALKRNSTSFPKIFLSMVTIGEESGRLEEVFEVLQRYFSEEYVRRKKLKAIISYPLLILIISAISVYIITTKLMPKFISNMRIDERSLPKITRFYIALGDILQRFSYLLIPLTLVIIILITQALKRWGGHGYLDRIKYKSIFTRGIYVRDFGCRFTMALQMIIACGIDIKNAFELLKKSEDSNYIKEIYDKAIESLEKGSVLSEVIKDFTLFPEEFTVSIFLGEESGTLEEVLLVYKEIFEEDLKERIEGFMKILGPGLILLAGLFLLSIYVAVMMPIYSMYSK